LPEAQHVLEDAEHRLNRAFTLAIVGTAALGFERMSHPANRILGDGWWRIGHQTLSQWHMMTVPAQRDERRHLLHHTGLDIGLTKVAIIGQ
jgi:hypothetical protein